MPSTVTETFALFALRLNAADARMSISRSARAFGVTLDAVEERKHLVNIELVVTVTGDPNRIKELRKMLGHSGGGGTDASWINATIN